VDQREAPGYEPRLVALQVPHQMPRRPPAGGRVQLLQRLLHPVLPYIGEAGGERRLHRVQPEALGDGDDRDRFGPTCRRLPPRDLGPYVGQPPGQGTKIHSRKK